MKTIEIDIECRSDVDLTKAGVYRYVDSPYFAITLMSVSVDGGEVQLYDLENGDCVPDFYVNQQLFHDNLDWNS